MRTAALRLALVSLLSIVLSSNCDAATFARQKIAHWGDPFTLPQTRTRCSSEASGNGWKTCNGWAVDYRIMQVELYAMAIGPNDLVQAAADAVAEVARTCTGLAVAAAGGTMIATPSPEPSARIAAGIGIGTKTFNLCIAKFVDELTAVGVVAASLKLALDSDNYWSNWSNEGSIPDFVNAVVPNSEAEALAALAKRQRHAEVATVVDILLLH